ncbi:hypothetical protein KIW84_034503 [Lathyrus oleraceus]|uniref:DUF7745 domain-containing protein n=1 Tax=Pisum sativum TaxID=3888 RepID=A0A9D4XYL5_PEA|nr:hypothetical protein KIW84_034503 [Pisum sativum]
MESNISLLSDNCRMLAIYPPLSRLSFTRMLGIDCLSLLVSHLLYTSVPLVSFPFEYIIHGLPIMNNMSHALFSWNPLLIFPSWARFVFLVESNIHPINKSAVLAFFRRNPIPTLVGDVYYSVHNRNEKRCGGLIRCCAQLLYKWFMGYLPSRGAFVLLDHTVNWATKLMGLRAKDIAWTHSSGVGQDFICSCGSFPNVPLIGVQGCINYNPTLLKRQMGFAMEVPPLKSEIQETLYFPVEGNQARLRQVSDAWRSIQRKGKFSWGRANNRSFPPFDDWLSKRVELTFLPFPVVDPWYPLIEESHPSVSMEEFLEMKRDEERERSAAGRED